jgi:hypothetical protein
MERWNFVQGRSGAWAWRCAGGLRVRLRDRYWFATIDAAIESAQAYGFMPGLSRLGHVIVRRRKSSCAAGTDASSTDTGTDSAAAGTTSP